MLSLEHCTPALKSHVTAHKLELVYRLDSRTYSVQYLNGMTFLPLRLLLKNWDLRKKNSPRARAFAICPFFHFCTMRTPAEHDLFAHRNIPFSWHSENNGLTKDWNLTTSVVRYQRLLLYPHLSLLFLFIIPLPISFVLEGPPDVDECHSLALTSGDKYKGLFTVIISRRKCFSLYAFFIFIHLFVAWRILIWREMIAIIL